MLCREIAAEVPLGLVVGVDLTEDAVRAARAALRDVDNVMLIWLDGDQIPWKDEFFTHVVLTAEPPSMAEIQRVLAADGTVLRPES